MSRFLRPHDRFGHAVRGRGAPKILPGFAGFRRVSPGFGSPANERLPARAPLTGSVEKRYKMFRKIVFLHRLECWNTPRTHFLECPDDMTVWNHGAKLSCRRDRGHSLQKRIRNPKTGRERRKEEKTKIRRKKKKLARKEGKKRATVISLKSVFLYRLD